MWLWFCKVYHRTYASKFIFNILFRIIVWTLRFLSLHIYLQLHSMYSFQWFAVCLIFLYISSYFFSYLSLTQPVFVHEYLYLPLCHKFRICIFTQFNFITLFNAFICKYFISLYWHCNVVVSIPLVCHSYREELARYLSPEKKMDFIVFLVVSQQYHTE